MAALTADQELATKAFMEAASEMGASCVSRATAVKFLLARKFEVARAVALWRQHEATRRREGLMHLDPLNEPLKSELATAKFTILPHRDATGAAIAVFTANRHSPTLSTHQTTLQGVVYQLDAALTSVETQRAGLVFIYDMTDSKYTNFDYDLSQKILTLLKGGYPAKLKKVLIVTAPLWFKAPFRILRLFVREKLRERVHTVSAPQLCAHVPRSALPQQLGGPNQLDHQTWLLHCLKCFTNSTENGSLRNEDSHPQNYVIPTHCGDSISMENGNIHSGKSENERLSGDEARVWTDGDLTGANVDNQHDLSNCRTESPWCSEGEAGGSLSSGYSEEESGGAGGAGGAALTPPQLLEHVRARGRAGLLREYEELRARPPQGTFLHAKLPNNLPKNRYTDVLCYDHSRVVLSQTDPDDPCSDYINANYVDGYRQKNAFICTQGPLPQTFAAFWQMVWEQHALVVVMATRTVERGRVKCGQYWPAEPGHSQTHGAYRVCNAHVLAAQDHVVTTLTLTNLQTEEEREVAHWAYVRWPDYGVPGAGAAALLAFLAGVRAAQEQALNRLGDAWAGPARGPPLVVHCSAGIGRTGTFLTLDICMWRLDATGACDVRGAVERIRAQRAHSIQMPEQYAFCYLAVLEHAARRALLPDPRLHLALAAFRHSPDDDSD